MSTITLNPCLPGAPAVASKGAVRTGRALTTLAVLFLALDGVAKLLRPEPVMTGTVQLGYAASAVLPIGVVLLACVALYAIPRTSVLGAVLLTGYLGGAIATHVRVGNPLFTHILFPVYVAALVWGGLFLRRPALRVMLPWRAAA
jgi:hypothetical protein